MRRTSTLALLAALLMVGWVAAPTAAAAGAAEPTLTLDVAQNGDGSATVTVNEPVTENNSTTTSPVANASVTVEVLDNTTSYAGAGNYTTDENGTVSLPAPNETVNVSIVAAADNRSADTTATLAPGADDENGTNGSFGQQVSSFVHQLQNDSNVTHIGPIVVNFVLENNPGSPPAHAGPPEWLTNDSVNRTQGPPAHAGPPDDGNESENDSEGGPPDDRGNDGKTGKDRCNDDNEKNDKNCGDDGDDGDSGSLGVRVLPAD